MHHAAVRVCAASGMLAGPYCPGRSYASSVRIIGGSPDSADGPYLYTGNLRKCTVHTSAPPVVPEPPVTQEPDTPSENPDAGTNANPGEGTNTNPPQEPDAGADAEPDAGTVRIRRRHRMQAQTRIQTQAQARVRRIQAAMSRSRMKWCRIFRWRSSGYEKL